MPRFFFRAAAVVSGATAWVLSCSTAAAAAPDHPYRDSIGSSLPPITSDIDATGSLSLRGGYGFGGDGEALNPYGFGFGLRLGATFSDHVYLGVSGTHHLGEHETVSLVERPGSANVNVGLSYASGEMGAVIPIGKARLRPYVGVGPTWLQRSCTSTSLADAGACEEVIARAGGQSEGMLHLSPAVALEVPVGNVYAGLDVGYHYMPAAENLSEFSTFATVGFHL